MTKGEAIRVVEGWVREFESPNELEAITALSNPPIPQIKRLLQEVKNGGR